MTREGFLKVTVKVLVRAGFLVSQLLEFHNNRGNTFRRLPIIGMLDQFRQLEAAPIFYQF